MPVENGMPEQDDVRKKALLRLAVAGIVTVSALAGLWWLDQASSEKKKPIAEKPVPAPIVSAPLPQSAPPQAEAMPEPPDDETQPISPEPANEPVQAELPSEAAPPPPPPRVSNTPRAPTTGHTPPPSAATITPPAPTRVATPPVPAIASDKGYVIQLGVFSNPDNAREMVEKLNRQGIRAHMETRVQVGPFLNRSEAEKARAEMRKLGLNALVTRPYPTTPATK